MFNTLILNLIIVLIIAIIILIGKGFVLQKVV